jgi:hypothetical protein
MPAMAKAWVLAKRAKAAAKRIFFIRYSLNMDLKSNLEKYAGIFAE